MGDMFVHCCNDFVHLIYQCILVVNIYWLSHVVRVRISVFVCDKDLCIYIS